MSAPGDSGSDGRSDGGTDAVTGATDSAAGTAAPSGQEQATPVIRFESGRPTAEEVAVVVAVLTTAPDSGSGQGPKPVRSLWNSPGRALRPSPGPGAWRASALPR